MDVQEYLQEAWNGEYKIDIPIELYNALSDEGWIDEQNEEYGYSLDTSSFAYLILSISEEDKEGLISMSKDTLEKFNQFDIKLKQDQEYPFSTCDFIDYENGIVYIVTLADNLDA